MAVPKRKTSKARRDQRRANWKLTAPGYVACPQCHEPKMPHHVCPECGYYDGKEVVKAAEEGSKKNQIIPMDGLVLFMP